MNTREGVAAPALIALIVILAVGGAAVYFGMTGNPEGPAMEDGEKQDVMTNDGDAMHKDDAMMEEDGAMMEKEDGDAMEKSGGAMVDDGSAMMEDTMMADDVAMMEKASYSGTLLAGSKDRSPLLDFTKADYDKAIASGKLVTLYFYASWCPICRAEFPKMQSAFDKLDRSDVVGFRVNYNDSDTDVNEEALAREFGVAYQHTKVFVKGDTRVLKSPESWNESRYSSEIATYAN